MKEDMEDTKNLKFVHGVSLVATKNKVFAIYKTSCMPTMVFWNIYNTTQILNNRKTK
jgi:hypothetical protein